MIAIEQFEGADPIEFEMGGFASEDKPEDAYRTIEYNGRTYLAYGTLGKTYKKRMLEAAWVMSIGNRTPTRERLNGSGSDM